MRNLKLKKPEKQRNMEKRRHLNIERPMKSLKSLQEDQVNIAKHCQRIGIKHQQPKLNKKSILLNQQVNLLKGRKQKAMTQVTYKIIHNNFNQ